MIFDCLTTISFFQLPINNTGATIESLEQDVLTQQTVAAIIELSIHKLSVVVNQLALVLELISKVTEKRKRKRKLRLCIN
jgi:hypothetical protein